ncbi:hypothetical protein [Fibrella forsythiae]|uniref:Uncharacterized protein n=1 Tax=Fibrella forsythiae TaxID=2817061 RepID=A0ABS3JSP7_9BACT|nr:hypothetical protein [Fibrella forsythiae]MBO0953003.1 hypothetical protein [Fibrella forsythiae]
MMNRALFLFALLATGAAMPAYCQAQSAVFSRVDTLHNQLLPLASRVGRRPGLASTPLAGQLLTLVVRPAGSQGGQDIFLPIDVDSSSVCVRSGDSLLRLETDYIFLPTNRLRIVSQAALRSDQAVRLTYRRLTYRP